jgi:hypothetical protein
MKNRSSLTLILMLIGLADWSLAHQPWFNPGSPTRAQAYQIQQPNISKVITAEAKGGRDWYSLEVKAGFKLDVALFVGAPCVKDFKPRLYLVGPGLEGPGSSSSVPFEMPAGTGALQLENAWGDYSGHGVVARRTPTLLRTLATGRYDLVVDHGNARGWYFISLGGDEVMGGSNEGRAALSRFNRCG